MVGPSPQNMQDQMNQDQQNAWMQAVAQQQPIHPMMASGGAYPPPPSMVPQMIAPQGAIATTSVPLAMGKLSLLAITLSLMLLGAFTFLGGFFLGMWFESPRPSPYVSRVGEVPTLGLLPPQQQMSAAPQMADVPAQGGGVVQGIRQGAQDIGFGNIASNQAGYVTQSAVTRTHVPGVPSFLTPLITATQYAVGQQLGYKAQQQVGHDLSGVISNAPQSSSSPQAEMGKGVQRMPVFPHQNVRTSPLSDTTPGEATPGAPPPAPLSQGEKGDYTVQLGVYASKENAMSLVNHLQGLNYTSHLTEGKSTDGGTLYYVHSGDYQDYSMALDAASQYVAQNIPGAVVVKITQEGKGTT